MTELLDGGRLVHGDILAGGDWVRAELANTSSCPNCGELEPVRLEGGTCSACSDYPRCVSCGRWVSDGSNWLPGHEVIEWDGADVIVCLPCLEEVA